jgi:hypothetical protein
MDRFLGSRPQWLLTQFSSADEVVATDKYLLDRLACYVGETLRKKMGGIWTLECGDTDDAFYGLPVVRREGKAPDCPLTIVTAALDRRRGDYMQTILQNMLESE